MFQGSPDQPPREPGKGSRNREDVHKQAISAARRGFGPGYFPSRSPRT